MKTLVVSDLHLGASTGADVARRPELREPLVRAAAEADRVVLLGDVLELRDGPLHLPLAAARPFMEELGEAMGDRPVVAVAGNHDHQLVSPWLERRRRDGVPPPLGLEQVIPAEEASETAATLQRWLGRAELTVAHPGLWLADGVYATHGHYLDRHITIPSFERLGARVVDRILRGRGTQSKSVDDYEDALGPVYALLYAVAQAAPEQGTGTSRASERAWGALVGDGGRRPMHHRLAAAVGLPAAVGALNLAGLGPLSPKLTGSELRRAALRAMGKVVDGLEIPARHVLFGHTHRSGPWPGDDPADWRAPGGAALMNTGSWVYARLFLTARPSESPYWPGVVAVVEEGQPPQLRRLLGERGHEELAPLSYGPAIPGTKQTA